MGTPKTTLSLSEKFRVYEVLKPMLVKDTDGYWRYVAEGIHTDALATDHVRAATGIALTPVNLRHIRQEMFGHLRTNVLPHLRQNGDDSALRDEVAALRELVVVLRGDLATLTERVDHMAAFKGAGYVVKA